MLQKLRIHNHKEGFTLIELMIVIAIIGILAAIAIPNFISYRNKTYCSAAESDANTIGGAISDYFAIPTRTAVSADDIDAYVYPGIQNEFDLLGGNDPNGTITIHVTDRTKRCPDDYQKASAYWNAGVYTKYIR